VQIDAGERCSCAARARPLHGAAAARASVVTVEPAPPLALRVTATPIRSGSATSSYSVTVTNTGGYSAGPWSTCACPRACTTSGCQAVSDGGTLPAACASGRDVRWTITSLPAGSSRTLYSSSASSPSLAGGRRSPHATARVRDVAGAPPGPRYHDRHRQSGAGAHLNRSADRSVRTARTYVLRYQSQRVALVSTVSVVLPPA
jgi:hypothetical protein